ncbi:carboxylesterase family protein [Streptomyces sp. SAJ15]|uniref:carboxylesterase family protein n=1 Tax=Streptomyces sp. SAJ15 TaxID=2011095 RepID=UPI001184BFBC|nr:carboxylesterase family protein [Streptomyces sp. SAJ15]TVL88789.1 hypothetical protein CD790_30085 [Streptomyces sp. SAJ15]
MFPDAPPFTPAQRDLSDRMIGYWTRFAHAADPNAPGAPPWPRLLPRGRAAVVQSLAPGPGGIGPVDAAAEHRCDFWRQQAQDHRAGGP